MTQPLKAPWRSFVQLVPLAVVIWTLVAPLRPNELPSEWVISSHTAAGGWEQAPTLRDVEEGDAGQAPDPRGTEERGAGQVPALGHTDKPSQSAYRDLRAKGVAGLAAPVASYDIEARLSSDGKLIHGRERVRYRNTSEDTLSELYLHLYLNAFRSPDTIWMREAGAQHRGFAFDADEIGAIEIESILIGNQPAMPSVEGDATIARLPLAERLAPLDEVQLTIQWTSQLPRVFARTGWAPGGFTMAGQWYPKLAVYDTRRGGWDREPWHANAEFFHDFGDYSFALRVPSRRSVVATGIQVGKEDHEDGTSTWRFAAQSVNDFAWLAAEDYLVQSRPFDDKTIVVALPATAATLAPRYFKIAEASLRRFEQWLGPYPWPSISIVVPHAEAMAAGGMEYPMLVTTLFPSAPALDGLHDVEMVTAHELAHEWFPMQIATDEAREPWLDEALAEHLTERVMREVYGADRSLLDLPFARLGYDAQFQLGMAGALRLPVTRRAWDYDPGEYGAAVYAKGGALLSTMHRIYGEEAFTAALRAYVAQWRWGHPTGDDFRAALTAGLPYDSSNPVDGWLDQLAFGNRALGVRAEDLREDRATITRTGDAALPVEGIVRFASGRWSSWRLSAGDDRLELAAPEGERIAAAIADPGQDLVIAPHALARASSARPELSSLAGLTARLVEIASLVLQALVLFA